MNYKQAKIADSAKVAKETVLVGNITIGEESTVLFFTAMRCEGEESIVMEIRVIYRKIVRSM